MQGSAALHAKLAQFVREAPKTLGAALYTEALLVEKVSRERTPVATGALRASHETSLPLVRDDEVSVTIVVGGPSAPYAIKVHEMVEVRHRVGQAKFLESAVLESKADFAQRVAERLEEFK